ncbi:MAG: hypothetical protein AB2A00_29090 [Myxococcota bacterium]
MGIIQLANLDFEAHLGGRAVTGDVAVGRQEAASRLFALCGPPHSEVLVSHGHELVPLDAERLRAQARELGFYEPAWCSAAAWNLGARELLAYAQDERAHALARDRKLRAALTSPGVVSAVNSKAWSSRVAREAGLDRDAFSHVRLIHSEQELKDHLKQVPEVLAARWTLKPLLGFAGGGRIGGGAEGMDARHTERFATLLREDGAMLWEPWVEREADFSTQIHVDAVRGVSVLMHGEMLNTTSGRYTGNRSLTAGATAWPTLLRDLEHGARVVGASLQREGYAGVAGIDAFTYRDPLTGALSVRPIVEVNARFTMGLMAGHLANMAMACGTFPPGSSWSFTLDSKHLLGIWQYGPPAAETAG